MQCFHSGTFLALSLAFTEAGSDGYLQSSTTELSIPTSMYPKKTSFELESAATLWGRPLAKLFRRPGTESYPGWSWYSLGARSREERERERRGDGGQSSEGIVGVEGLLDSAHLSSYMTSSSGSGSKSWMSVLPAALRHSTEGLKIEDSWAMM